MASSFSRLRCWAFIGTVAALLVGCGDGGLKRYRVSGDVSFQGKPVPAGSIIFTPDTAKGNAGPQGTANIIDGR